MKNEIFESCTKVGCSKEADLTCEKCKFKFCGAHLKGHIKRKECLIK